MTLELALPDYRLFPYERRLAEKELSAFGVTLVRKTDDHFVVESPVDLSLLPRLTYVAWIGVNGHSYETEIAKFERVHRTKRARRESRQATRYHVHGIHEETYAETKITTVPTAACLPAEGHPIGIYVVKVSGSGISSIETIVIKKV